MHLTPRTLGLAVVATLTGCTVLGIMTSLDLADATGSDAQGSPTAISGMTAESAALPPTSWLDAATPSATTPPASPSPGATANVIPAPTALTAAPPSPAPGKSSPEATPEEPVPAASPRATAHPSKPSPTRPTPVASATPSRRPAPAPRRTATRNSWHAPALQVGTTTITRPRLTSGAPVSVTVACSPGAGCSMTAGQLHVTPGTSVTVTWAAPSRPGYTAWRTTRAL